VGRSRCAGALGSNLKEDDEKLVEGHRKKGRQNPTREYHNDSNNHPMSPIAITRNEGTE